MPSVYHCPIDSVERLSETIWRLKFRCPAIASQARPGQFVNIRITEGIDPLWRRPFSIHSVNRKKGCVTLLFEQVGRGTALLAHKRPGESLNVLGPLGNNFLPPKPGTQAVLVAGGLGVAPLFFLADELQSKGREYKVLFGAKTRDALCCAVDLQERTQDVRLATEDGSEGHRGLVTELLEEVTREQPGEGRFSVFACGPEAMLKAVAEICGRNDLWGQISLETVMACGIGACMGCAVRMRGQEGTTDSYHLACKDGPVFDIAEVNFDT